LAELADIFDPSVEFDEPTNAVTHPDEMDDFYDEEDAVNEELKRLQEVTEIEANNSDDDEEEEEELNEATAAEQDGANTATPQTVKEEEITLTDILEGISSWTWTTNR